MRLDQTPVIAALLSFISESSALAQQITPTGPLAVPGPIMGAGLPLLLLAGGYALIRHHQNGKRD